MSVQANPSRAALRRVDDDERAMRDPDRACLTPEYVGTRLGTPRPPLRRALLEPWQASAAGRCQAFSRPLLEHLTARLAVESA